MCATSKLDAIGRGGGGLTLLGDAVDGHLRVC